MEKHFIADVRSAALEKKKSGVSSDDAAKQLTVDFKAKYPDWPNMNLAAFVRSIYQSEPRPFGA